MEINDIAVSPEYMPTENEVLEIIKQNPGIKQSELRKHGYNTDDKVSRLLRWKQIRREHNKKGEFLLYAVLPREETPNVS